MGKHALLSASSSHRWLNCPPSVRLCESYEDKGNNYAAEGTAAHTLCEYKLKVVLGIRSKDPTADLTYYNAEMEDCANGYAAYILELVETAKQSCADPVVLIEQRLDFSKYVEGGFGTGDCLVIADGTLHIVDYKHGQGVLVEAGDNPQMKLYALGALEIFDGIYDINTVSMTIYQPRRDNVSTHTVFKGASKCGAKNIPEKILQRVCAEVLNLEEFDEDVFLDQVEKIVVNGEDELIFHFHDGEVITQPWESTARTDWWTPEARAAKSAYNKKHPRSSGTITCFSCKISCSKCGQNLRRNTSTRVSGEKAHHWRCPPHNDCGHRGLEENHLKTISTDVLGINDFDEDEFTDKVDRITVVSNEELIFHLKDGSDVTRQWHFKRRQPAWSEERKQRQSKKMTQVWRDKHEQSENS